MKIATTKFGQIQGSARDLLLFPEGLIGFEDLRLWLLLREQALVWLQSAEQAEIALPCASPYTYQPDYQPRFNSTDAHWVVSPPEQQPLLLAVVNRNGGDWTLNLRAPLVVRLADRTGRQIITANEQSLRCVLPRAVDAVRKTA